MQTTYLLHQSAPTVLSLTWEWRRSALVAALPRAHRVLNQTGEAKSEYRVDEGGRDLGDHHSGSCHCQDEDDQQRPDLSVDETEK